MGDDTSQNPATDDEALAPAPHSDETYEQRLLWLGHESPNTTHRYVEADLAMKEKALARLEEPNTKMRRYRPPDQLMAFLQQL